MSHGAAGRKGAGHGKEHNFLICPFLAGVVVLGDAAGGYVGGLGGIGDVPVVTGEDMSAEGRMHVADATVRMGFD
jgi:hypothetical protein